MCVFKAVDLVMCESVDGLAWLYLITRIQAWLDFTVRLSSFYIAPLSGGAL